MTELETKMTIAHAGILADLEELTILIEDTDLDGGWGTLAELNHISAKLTELLEFAKSSR